MKVLFVGTVATACLAGLILAQARITPTDPQPTCNMCPGYHIPESSG